MLALGREYTFPTWIDFALVLIHARSGTRPDRQVLADLHHQLVTTWSGAAVWRQVFCLCAFAELSGEVGQVEDALGALASIPGDARDAFYAPEIYRIEGEMLLRRSEGAMEDAERCFRTAYELARERAERSLELRAATSLARLWQRQGKRDEARRLVTDVYGWFTEGFETADLRRAKALLDALSITPP